jgi:RNA ligase (TIGR02306 family)
METVATIETISEIKPHINADKLELATVCGFQTVVKKEEFKVGDKCVYIKSDSILKEHPEFEFLRSKNFRIRQNTKFRGEVSSGIAFPVFLLERFNHPSGMNNVIGIIKETPLLDGYNVSDIIGASHYEKPIASHLVGLIKGNFPPYIPKTDETRLQGVKFILEELKGKEVYITLKCDGTSSTFANNGVEIDVCSRNLSVKLDDDASIYNQIAKKYNLIEKLKAFNPYSRYGIQGEICGGKIQGNPMALKEDKRFVFNVWNVDEQKYIGYYGMQDICDKLELEMVPLIQIVSDFSMSFDELVEMSKRTYEGD